MKRRIVVLSLLLILLVTGCAYLQGTNSATLPPQQEFLLNAEKAYLIQYNDYLAMSKKTNLTDPQKEIMKTKKAVLVQVEPLIKIYRASVSSGGPQDLQMEQQIYNLLNSIGGGF
jgi:hypothetical protein